MSNCQFSQPIILNQQHVICRAGKSEEMSERRVLLDVKYPQSYVAEIPENQPYFFPQIKIYCLNPQQIPLDKSKSPQSPKSVQICGISELNVLLSGKTPCVSFPSSGIWMDKCIIL